MQEQSFPFQDVKGNSYTGILSTPDSRTDKVVVLGHGFLSHKNSHTNLRLTDLLVSKGIATLRFDWDGMGETSTPFANVTVETCCRQLESAISNLHAYPFPKVGLIGSSFGGLITTLVASRVSSLQSVGLKCPVVDFPEVLRLRLGEQGMAEWKRTNQMPHPIKGIPSIHLNFSFFEECCQHDAFTVSKQIQAPTLIVHGDHDETVPLKQAEALYNTLRTEKDLRIIKGADHQFGRPEDFQEMTDILSQWTHLHL
jgi:pimeloyl-ACP methyl ester carboxylesterase